MFPASFYHPQKVWDEINWGYNQAAYIRNNLDGSPQHVSAALTKLHSRIAQIGASLHSDSAHHPHLQRSYESLRFQAKTLTALLKSSLPVSPPQQSVIPQQLVQSALAQELPMGNFVEGSTNQLKYAKCHAITGGHEAGTPIAATAASLLLGLPLDSPHETYPEVESTQPKADSSSCFGINGGHIDFIINEGMQRYNRLLLSKQGQGTSEDQNSEVKSTQPKTDSLSCFGMHHNPRQIAFAELKLAGDFLNLNDVVRRSKWEIDTPESAVHTARLIIGSLHNQNRFWEKMGALILHGGKTYAVVLLNKTIYFFDSHGFSSNEDNAYIAHFTDDRAAVQFLARKMPYQPPPSDKDIPDQANKLTIHWIAITS